MKRMCKSVYGPSTALALVLGGLLACQPLAAQEKNKSFFTVPHSLGLALLGGSAALVYKGFDYHDKADNLFDRYKEATDPQEASRLFQRTTNRDVKSQVSWALGAALAITGVRLLLTHDSTQLEERALASVPDAGGLAMDARVDARRAGLEFSLKKAFF